MNLSLRLPAWMSGWRARALPVAAAFRWRSKRRDISRLASAATHARETLLAFDEATRDEFLRLSECLTPLGLQLGEMAEQAAQLDRLLEDRDEDHAYASAFELYKKSVDLAHASIGIALSQEEEMERLEGSLLQNEHHFARNSLMFRTLVLSVRAEAVRIDAENQSVFVAVATEMAGMERAMSAAVGEAFGELASIVAEAAAGRAELQRLQNTLHQDARLSIESLRTGLDDLKRELAPCIAANQEIVTLLAQTRTHTAEIVTALQYQDIVRQQLEHVGAGFDDIAALAQAATRAKADLGGLLKAGKLQQAQLQGSKRSIEQAEAEITRGGNALLDAGRRLNARFGEMEERAQAVLGGATLSGLLRRETEHLVQLASSSEATNDRIAHLLDRIEESVRIFSTEIRHHEFEVQLVALNAQIAAARVPHAGALNKLAEETARLAFATAELTQETTNQLADTLARLRDMRRDADKVRATIGKEKSDLEIGAVTVSAKLARLDERVRRGSRETMRRFDTLYGGAEKLLGALRFPSAIQACYAPAEDFCTQLIAATATATTSPEQDQQWLADHSRRYTMREEREVHARAVGLELSESQESTVDLFLADPADPAGPSATSDKIQAPATVPTAPSSDPGSVELF